jgi:hypothetical protein
VGVVISEEYYSEGQRHMFAMYIWIYPVYIWTWQSLFIWIVAVADT